MLWYILRVGVILLWHRVLKRATPAGEPFRKRLRAWPWRCDAYLHLNNAVYLRLAEDVRWAWTAQSGLLRHSLSEHWMFLVGGVDLIYRRPIPLMSSFEVVSSIVGADGRWLFFAQEFVLPSGKVAARALVRATIQSSGEIVRPESVLGLIGAEIPSPGADIEPMKAMAEAQLNAIAGR